MRINNISWQFGPFDPPAVLHQATLRDAGGTPVAATLQQAIGYFNTVALIPAKPLARASRYTVEMTVQQGGRTWQKTWTFQTR